MGGFAFLGVFEIICIQIMINLVFNLIIVKVPNCAQFGRWINSLVSIYISIKVRSYKLEALIDNLNIEGVDCIIGFKFMVVVSCYNFVLEMNFYWNMIMDWK